MHGGISESALPGLPARVMVDASSFPSPENGPSMPQSMSPMSRARA